MKKVLVPVLLLMAAVAFARSIYVDRGDGGAVNVVDTPTEFTFINDEYGTNSVTADRHYVWSVTLDNNGSGVVEYLFNVNVAEFWVASSNNAVMLLDNGTQITHHPIKHTDAKIFNVMMRSVTGNQTNQVYVHGR